MKSKLIKILKFGGSSVGSANRIKSVCKIILSRRERREKNANNANGRIAVVVSAMQGVTDKLLALDFDWVKEKHLAAARELKVSPPLDLLNALEKVVGGIKLLGDVSPMALDLVASFGEKLSAHLVAAYLNKKIPAISVDSRELVKTDNNFQNAAVDFEITNRKIRDYFNKLLKAKNSKLKTIPVITGFVGSTVDGQTTTLGRGGSDYTAAIFGAALNAEMIEIWTDVDGVMSADPRIVPAAITLPRLSYEEAFEMAHFGAKVIYPPTIIPAIKKNIPVSIKNTFNPNHFGTLITDSKNAKVYAPPLKKGEPRLEMSGNDAKVVKNISSIDDIGLINIGGANLVGMPGTAERIFKVIAAKKVNVILISQASSEYTVCLAIKKSDVEKAITALREEFKNELAKGQVVIDTKKDQCIVAAVGDNMRGVPGIAGKVFSILGQNKINISAIAQGSSERNISFVINRSDKIRAINALHHRFFGDIGTAGIFLIGTGIVGGELLRQIANLKLRTSNFKHLKVCAIADVNKMVFNNNGLDLKNWRQVLQRTKSKVNLQKFLAEARNCLNATKMLVDCTASEAIAKMYPEFVMAGCDIITPNKKANVLPISKYNALRKTLVLYNKAFHYQANVGAGLPIIVSIKELVAAGDKIKKIEGIFSGTLSYLFNNYDGKRKFSEFIQEAKQKGYTEPDPKEDLSGQDVGRKLLILAREMDMPAELADIKLENLADCSDNYLAKRYKKAKVKNCVLRYVGTVAGNKLSAKLKEVPMNDPLANIQGTDNIVAIYSNYYSKNPLVIKGPGAGAEVTAAAVLAGIIKTTKNLWKI